MLVDVRTLVLHHVHDQITKLPVEIRDQLTTTGKIEGRLRRLEQIDISVVLTLAGEYRLSWLIPLVDQDRADRRQIRRLERDLDALLDEHGTTLRDESGIGPIAAATLITEVGDPFRFARRITTPRTTRHRRGLTRERLTDPVGRRRNVSGVGQRGRGRHLRARTGADTV